MKSLVTIATIMTLGALLSGCAVASVGSSIVDAGASVVSVPFDVTSGAIDAVSGDDEDDAEH